MELFQYGEGKIKTQVGITHDGLNCITITRCEQRPIGSKQREWNAISSADEHDVILTFKNIEGARVLQDTLNGMISKWVEDTSERVD